MEGSLVSGTLPSEVAQLSSVVDLWVQNNERLGGTIPDGVFALPRVYAIRLSDCNFSGTLDSVGSGLSVLSALNISNNQFSGSISSIDWAGLPALRLLDISNNQFSGSIPDDLSKLPFLHVVSVNGNCFTGSFPQSICSSRLASPVFLKVVADCAPDWTTGVAPMPCECCTVCCDPETEICADV